MARSPDRNVPGVQAHDVPVAFQQQGTIRRIDAEGLAGLTGLQDLDPAAAQTIQRSEIFDKRGQPAKAEVLPGQHQPRENRDQQIDRGHGDRTVQRREVSDVPLQPSDAAPDRFRPTPTTSAPARAATADPPRLDQDPGQLGVRGCHEIVRPLQPVAPEAAFGQATCQANARRKRKAGIRPFIRTQGPGERKGEALLRA
jgi:hypothetical protein